MTNQQIEAAIADLQAQIARLVQYMEERQQQQITRPLDLTSKKNIGAIFDAGVSNTVPTQSINIASVPATINVLRASGTLIVQTANFGIVELLRK